MVSALVIIYGDIYPLSNCIPSTTSFSTPKDCPSSTVITPSLPTASIASAIISPISLSFAEIDATWEISSLEEISLLISFNFLMTFATFTSISFLISIGLTPADTNFNPS